MNPSYTFTNAAPSYGGYAGYTKALQAVLQNGNNGSLYIETFKNMTEDEVKAHVAGRGGNKDYPAPTIVTIVPVVIYS